MKIMKNKDEICNKMVFNIGNPYNNIIIKDLALLVKEIFEHHSLANSKGIGKKIRIEEVGDKVFYGEGYEDVSFRVPSIRKAENPLDWKPKTDIKTALKKTIDFYVNDYIGKIGESHENEY